MGQQSIIQRSKDTYELELHGKDIKYKMIIRFYFKKTRFQRGIHPDCRRNPKFK